MLKDNKKKLSTHISEIITTDFYLGKLPLPGVWGTTLGLLIFLIYKYFFISNTYILIFTVSLFIISIFCVQRYERYLNKKDPSEIIIDETIGFLSIVIFLPFSWFFVTTSFILFRIIDNIKPFPIRWLEDKYRGGFWTIFDDLLAGVYTLIFCYILIKIGYFVL